MNEIIDKDNSVRDRNIGGDYIAGDKAGGGIVKNSTAGGDIAAGNIIKKINQSIEQNRNEYLQGLKELTEKLDGEYKKYNVPEEKKTEINNSILDLEKEVKDLKPATKVDEKPATKVENLSPTKKIQIEAKTTTLVDKIFDALPETSETVANLIPFLSPFSKVIRGGVQSIVDTVKNYKNPKS